MQFSALRYFLETARLGSIRRAAEILYAAPSAVSRQIVHVYLRTLLIHGARSAVLAAKRQSGNKNVWLANLLNRRHPNIAAVALANKNVRTVWALIAHDRDFNPHYVPIRAAA
jgi:hypothetical protein